MTPVRISRHPSGPRLYIVGRRAHHGTTFGLAAVVALASRRYRLAAVLAAYAATDWQDFPFRDIDNHEPRRRHR